MKKLSIILICAVMISMLAAPQAAAVSEEEQVTEVIEGYLSNWAQNSCLYEDSDLDLLTVLNEAIDQTALELAASEAARSEKLGEHFYSGDGSVNADKLKKNMQFMKDKAEYFSEIRQYSGIERTNFSAEYVITDCEIQGNLAVVQVLENVSFQYAGTPEPSFGQTEYIVSAVKADGEWFVANVETKYDWFDSEYKNTDYDISAIIAAEKENIKAQADSAQKNEEPVQHKGRLDAASLKAKWVAKQFRNCPFRWDLPCKI